MSVEDRPIEDTAGDDLLDTAGDEIADGEICNLEADDLDSGSPRLDAPKLRGRDSLTSLDITTGSPVLDSPTLAHIFNLSADDFLSGSPALDSPTIAQEHALIAETELTSGIPDVGTPRCADYLYELSCPDFAAQFPVLDTPDIGQIHVLTTSELITSLPRLDFPYIQLAPGFDLLPIDLLGGLPVLGMPWLNYKVLDGIKTRWFEIEPEIREFEIEHEDRIYIII